MILLVIRVQSLRDDLLAHRRAQGTPPVQIDLFDDDVGGKPAVMGSLAGIDGAPSRPRRTFEEWLDVGGQRWRLVGRPSEAFLSQHLTKRPLALGITVLLFWESAGGLALLLLTRRKDAALRRQSRVSRSGRPEPGRGRDRGRRATAGSSLFNPAAERILGMGRQEVGLLEWSRTYGCFYPDTRTPYPPEQLPLARALRGEETDEEMFIRNPRVPDGIWISVSGAPLRDERRGLDGGVVVIRDITAWKRSSEELRRLSSAVEQTADTVVITNRDGVIEYVNPAFEATTGYSREEAIGQTPRILKSGKTDPQQYAELWKHHPGRPHVPRADRQPQEERRALPRRADDHADQGRGREHHPLRVRRQGHDGPVQAPGAGDRDGLRLPDPAAAVPGRGAPGAGLRHRRGRVPGHGHLRGLLRLHGAR